MIKFSAFRLNIIRVDNLFNVLKPKEEYFYEVIDNVTIINKKTFNIRNIKYIFYYVEELIPGVFCFELAKEETQIIPIEGENKVEEDTIIKTPFIYVLIDKNKQLILIQEKTSVFPDINTSRGKVEYLFNESMKENQITTFLEPIGDNKDFWKEVESSDSIYQLDLNLIAPNMFNGRIEAEKFVEEIRDNLNITEVDLKFKNKKGRLQLLKKNLDGYIKLIASGAGNFKLYRRKNGKKDNIKSDDFVQKRDYEIDTPHDIDKEQLDKDLKTLDILNEGENKKELPEGSKEDGSKEDEEDKSDDVINNFNA